MLPHVVKTETQPDTWGLLRVGRFSMLSKRKSMLLDVEMWNMLGIPLDWFSSCYPPPHANSLHTTRAEHVWMAVKIFKHWSASMHEIVVATFIRAYTQTYSSPPTVWRIEKSFLLATSASKTSVQETRQSTVLHHLPKVSSANLQIDLGTGAV